MWGAWIEIARNRYDSATYKSPPVWGAWIEIRTSLTRHWQRACRPPCGGRGLKWLVDLEDFKLAGRPPCGGRGLKLESYIKTAENSP